MRIILLADESKELESVLPSGNSKVPDSPQGAKQAETDALISAVKSVFPFAVIDPKNVDVKFFPKPQLSRTVAWCKCESAQPGPQSNGETFCKVCGGAVSAEGKYRPVQVIR